MIRVAHRFVSTTKKTAIDWIIHSALFCTIYELVIIEMYTQFSNCWILETLPSSNCCELNLIRHHTVAGHGQSYIILSPLMCVCVYFFSISLVCGSCFFPRHVRSRFSQCNRCDASQCSLLIHIPANCKRQKIHISINRNPGNSYQSHITRYHH